MHVRLSPLNCAVERVWLTTSGGDGAHAETAWRGVARRGRGAACRGVARGDDEKEIANRCSHDNRSGRVASDREPCSTRSTPRPDPTPPSAAARAERGQPAHMPATGPGGMQTQAQATPGAPAATAPARQGSAQAFQGNQSNTPAIVTLTNSLASARPPATSESLYRTYT